MKRITAIIAALDIALSSGAFGAKVASRTTEPQTVYIQQQSDRCLGTFSLTFYVPSKQYGKLTYSGETATHLASCAVDPDIIPLGSVIKITGDNGQTLLLRCNDIGGGIKGNRVDIFWDDTVAEGYDWMADFGTIQTVYIVG